MSEECPFKILQTNFFHGDVDDMTKIDYCKVIKDECVGEGACPIMKK